MHEPDVYDPCAAKNSDRKFEYKKKSAVLPFLVERGSFLPCFRFFAFVARSESSQSVRGVLPAAWRRRETDAASMAPERSESS